MDILEGNLKSMAATFQQSVDLFISHLSHVDSKQKQPKLLSKEVDFKRELHKKDAIINDLKRQLKTLNNKKTNLIKKIVKLKNEHISGTSINKDEIDVHNKPEPRRMEFVRVVHHQKITQPNNQSSSHISGAATECDEEAVSCNQPGALRGYPNTASQQTEVGSRRYSKMENVIMKKGNNSENNREHRFQADKIKNVTSERHNRVYDDGSRNRGVGSPTRDSGGTEQQINGESSKASLIIEKGNTTSSNIQRTEDIDKDLKKSADINSSKNQQQISVNITDLTDKQITDFIEDEMEAYSIYLQ